MGSNMDFSDIIKRLSICGWTINGTMATSTFGKNDEDNTLYRYTLDLIYKSATYERWKDGKRIKRDDMDYNVIIEKALKNAI